jgi:hypothetical protein
LGNDFDGFYVEDPEGAITRRAHVVTKL